jgi:hypothetical protein
MIIKSLDRINSIQWEGENRDFQASEKGIADHPHRSPSGLTLNLNGKPQGEG